MHGGFLIVVEQQRQQRSKLRWQKVSLRPRQFLKEPPASGAKNRSFFGSMLAARTCDVARLMRLHTLLQARCRGVPVTRALRRGRFGGPGALWVSRQELASCGPGAAAWPPHLAHTRESRARRTTPHL